MLPEQEAYEAGLYSGKSSRTESPTGGRSHKPRKYPLLAGGEKPDPSDDDEVCASSCLCVMQSVSLSVGQSKDSRVPQCPFVCPGLGRVRHSPDGVHKHCLTMSNILITILQSGSLCGEV